MGFALVLLALFMLALFVVKILNEFLCIVHVQLSFLISHFSVTIGSEIIRFCSESKLLRRMHCFNMMCIEQNAFTFSNKQLSKLSLNLIQQANLIRISA